MELLQEKNMTTQNTQYITALKIITLAMETVMSNKGLHNCGDEEANEKAPESFNEFVVQYAQNTGVTETDIDVMLNITLNDFYEKISNDSK
jgi:hypothetical protein